MNEISLEEDQRTKESFARIFVWSRVLLALSMVGIVVSLLLSVVLFYFLHYSANYTRFEIIPMHYIFGYLKKDDITPFIL